MAIELIDGKAGKPHIDGDDLGDFKRGVVGEGGGVLGTGNYLRATLTGALSVTVDTGSAVFPGCGRHVRVASPETVALKAAASGKKRNDIVALTWSRDGDTGVETASITVATGAETSSTPGDPKVPDGALPLYRVPVTGGSAGTPVQLFQIVQPLARRAGLMGDADYARVGNFDLGYGFTVAMPDNRRCELGVSTTGIQMRQTLSSGEVKTCSMPWAKTTVEQASV